MAGDEPFSLSHVRDSLKDKRSDEENAAVQRGWLAKQEMASARASADEDEEPAAAKRGFSAKMKLRAAIRATIISNHINQRRFADGTIRNDVKTGAAKEAHAHGVKGVHAARLFTHASHNHCALISAGDCPMLSSYSPSRFARTI